MTNTRLVVCAFVASIAMLTMGCASMSNNERYEQRHERTGEYLDDSVLTTKVKAAIFNEPYLKSTEITVETFKGVVQLSGFVSSSAAEHRAVEVARSIEGVKSVKNDMRLK